MIKAQVDIHIERKLTHILGVLVIVLLHHVLPPIAVWAILLLIGAPLIFFDYLRLRNEKMQQLTLKLFGGIMRRDEIHHLSGTSYLLAGAGLIFLIFPHNIVSLALLFLAVADPLASLVGVKYGTIKILGKKTLEGFIAAFAVSVIMAVIYFYSKNLMTDHLLVVSILSGLCSALAELVPVGNVDDNFTQPVLNSCALYCIFFLFGGFP